MPRKRQLELGLKHWGGKREGSGKKPNGAWPRVKHVKRPHLNGRAPLHVTMRVLPGIASLRLIHSPVRRALIAGAGSKDAGFRLIHYSILRNHLHLIVEGDSAKALSRGMKGLSIRIAWAVNRAMGRKRGKVFSDRYHSRVLLTARETNGAIHYVVSNYRRHLAQEGRMLPGDFVDRHSSAYYWNRDDDAHQLPEPKSWLLQTGYRRGGGEIDLSKTPGSIPKPAQRQRA